MYKGILSCLWRRDVSNLWCCCGLHRQLRTKIAAITESFVIVSFLASISKYFEFAIFLRVSAEENLLQGSRDTSLCTFRGNMFALLSAASHVLCYPTQPQLTVVSQSSSLTDVTNRNDIILRINDREHELRNRVGHMIFVLST